MNIFLVFCLLGVVLLLLGWGMLRSHQTDWVLMVWVHMLMFAAPFLAFAIIPYRRRNRYEMHPPSLAANG